MRVAVELSPTLLCLLSFAVGSMMLDLFFIGAIKIPSNEAKKWPKDHGARGNKAASTFFSTHSARWQYLRRALNAPVFPEYT